MALKSRGNDAQVAGTDKSACGDRVMRWIPALTAIALVTLAALVLYVSPALGISTAYQQTAEQRDNLRLQLNEMAAAVVAFDLTLLIGSFMRWRYVWPAAAVPFAVAVLVLFYGPLGTAK